MMELVVVVVVMVVVHDATNNGNETDMTTAREHS